MLAVKVLDLFSGIGGFSLGLERAGMETVAFCEINPFCQKVLRKHWPDVPIYDDVTELTYERLKADGITGIDVICGGFPCQDISSAGRRAGIEGDRSGLWSEIVRLVGEIRPRYAVVENVAALLSGGSGRWFGGVLGDLAEVGYDAEWHCIPASHVGAKHIRDRVWIVAHPPGVRRDGGDCMEDGRTQGRRKNQAERCSHGLIFEMGHPNSECLQGKRRAWSCEPSTPRVAYGLPNQLDRLKALGNAVVPQIPEIIGRAIMEQR